MSVEVLQLEHRKGLPLQSMIVFALDGSLPLTKAKPKRKYFKAEAENRKRLRASGCQCLRCRLFKNKVRISGKYGQNETNPLLYSLTIKMQLL